MLRILLRLLGMYALVAIVLIVYLDTIHRLSMHYYREYGALTGIGGMFLLLFFNRFGSGYVEDAMPLDEESELRRSSRRSWLFTALVVAIILLLTGIL